MIDAPYFFISMATDVASFCIRIIRLKPDPTKIPGYITLLIVEIMNQYLLIVTKKMLSAKK